MFERRVLRKVFRTERGKVRGNWRILRGNDCPAKQRVRWVQCVERMGTRWVLRGFWWENQQEGVQLEGLCECEEVNFKRA